MKVAVAVAGALVSAHAAGQIELTEYSLVGSAGVGNQFSDPGGNVTDDIDIAGPGGLNTTREITYDGVSGVSTRFVQSYSTISTGDSLTFTGSLTATEFYPLLPNLEPTELHNHQSHHIGGLILFTVPDNSLVRVTGSLHHNPELFPDIGQPVLLNGTTLEGFPGGLHASPLFPPSSLVGTVDTTTVMSGTRSIRFESHHTFGGVNSAIGLANTYWEVRIEIIPAPATFLLAPAGLVLASRRRR